MSDLLTRAEAASLAGISVSTLQSHRYPGERACAHPFPPPAMTVSRVPLWSRPDVEAWINERQGADAA